VAWPTERTNSVTVPARIDSLESITGLLKRLKTGTQANLYGTCLKGIYCIGRGSRFLLSSSLAPTTLSVLLAYTVRYRKALPTTAKRLVNGMCCISWREGGGGRFPVKDDSKKTWPLPNYFLLNKIFTPCICVALHALPYCIQY
jgi:hypothetical protein